MTLLDIPDKGFSFNIFGIFNTTRDNSIYKVKARLGDLEFNFNQVSWDFTTQSHYRVTAPKDFVIVPSKYELGQGSTIIWLIEKYCVETKIHEPDYAYAV